MSHRKSADAQSADSKATHRRGAEGKGANCGSPAGMSASDRCRAELGAEGVDRALKHSLHAIATSLLWVKSFVPSLLVLRHTSWEGPHRILDVCGSLAVRIIDPLEGDSLPKPAECAGAMVMGGPMNVDETDRYPALAREREWLAEAVGHGIPVLGICLGAQLLARALGARVVAGKTPEIGFSPVEIFDSADPLLGGLFPRTEVLHWHNDILELPEGAQRLASSALTENQAFRYGSAWGILFHPEADAALVEAWLSVPQMVAEATEALGSAGMAALSDAAAAAEQDLVRRSTPGFRAFAELVAKSGIAGSTGLGR